MKITIDIDCTPEEARAFMGLPDVKPMQDAVMVQLQEQLQRQIERADPDALMQTWLAPSIEGFAKFQNALWSAAMGKAKAKGEGEDDKTAREK